jgi:hypothetical protein
MKANKKSARFKAFAKEYGLVVYDLEALRLQALQQLVREAIEAVIYLEALKAEIEAERQDAVLLAGVRRSVVATLQDTDLELPL